MRVSQEALSLIVLGVCSALSGCGQVLGIEDGRLRDGGFTTMPSTDASVDASGALNAPDARAGARSETVDSSLADGATEVADSSNLGSEVSSLGCATGMTRKCADDLDSPALGNCGDGTETCAAGAWGPCSAKPMPADACTAGDDANCNGTKNDGCPCVDGTKQSCGPAADVGECRRGAQSCVGSHWGECVGAVVASPRDCTSALDHDCDGAPDSKVDGVCKCSIGAKQDCDTHVGKDGKGQCHPGTQTCVASADHKSSAFDACAGAVGPAAADTCEADNDNNCNGIPNEDCACVNGTTQPCGPPSATGICKRGTQTCTNSKWGACTGAVFPVGRDCTSAADNDCNGTADQLDATCECAATTKRDCTTTLLGPCKPGKQTCVLSSDKKSSSWGACTGNVSPGTKDKDGCNPGDDADCDGTPNEGCACVNGDKKACGVDVGACQKGTQTCVSSAWGNCDGEVRPGTANCSSSADNDCDGTNDNLEAPCKVCALGTTTNCTADAKGSCASGKTTCVLSATKAAVEWGPCVAGSKANADGCNPPDDANCNGTPGEGCCPTGKVCGSACCLPKANTTTACNGNSCQYTCRGYSKLSCNTATQPACGSWDFGKSQNAPDKQGWYIEGAPLTTVGTTALTTTGFALSTKINTASASPETVRFAVQPCSGGQSFDVPNALVVSMTITISSASGSTSGAFAYPGFSQGDALKADYGFELDLIQGDNRYVGTYEGPKTTATALFMGVHMPPGWTGTIMISDVAFSE